MAGVVSPRQYEVIDMNLDKAQEALDLCIGPGWVPLVSDLINEIRKVAPETEVLQVKEKFGGLRFYVGSTPRKVHDLISEAEAASFTICEMCGNPGKPRPGGWIKTLCDEHAKGDQ